MKQEVINAIKTLKTYLGMEVKLASMKLVDGTVIEAEMFEAGQMVSVMSPEGEAFPLPVGEYELEDGKLLVVQEEGVIFEIKELPAEEKEVEQPTEEMPVEASEETERQPKRVVESKEYHFSAEEIKALVDEVESLKKEIIDLKAEKMVELKEEEQPTDVVEFSEQSNPIKFNPENENKVDIIQLSPKAPESGIDRILKNLYN